MKIILAVAAVLLIALVAVVGLKYRRSAGWSLATTDATAESNPSAGGVSAANRVPVVIELFTSEGCSSCPPADAVLMQLEKNQPVAAAEIIALSEHVDYWNYIGWSDPFSSEAFSARQQAYAPIFGNDGVYTPQMVVDGQAEFIGSNSGKAQTAIARAAKLPKAEVKISQSRTSDPQAVELKVNVERPPALSAGDVVEVLLAITENNLSSQVARGENSGRRLGHTAVVRELRSLGQIGNADMAFTAETKALLNKEWKRNELRAVVFLQEHTHKRILGASAIPLEE
jgi:hypothetical protein